MPSTFRRNGVCWIDILVAGLLGCWVAECFARRTIMGSRRSTQQPSNSATLFSPHPPDPRQIRISPLVLEAVAGVDAVGDGEAVKMSGDIRGAGVGAVEQGDEPERGRRVHAQLAEKVILDHAGRHDIFEDVDVPLANVGVTEEVDLDGVGDLVVTCVADHVDEAITDVTRDGSQQVAEEAGGAFEDSEEKDLRVTGIGPDRRPDLTNSSPDLFLGEDGSDVLHPSPPSTLRRAFPPGLWSP